MAMFEPVPEAEFEADLAEHQAALDAGVEQTPPQLRAEAAAWGQDVPPASSTRPAPGLPLFSDQPAASSPPAAPSAATAPEPAGTPLTDPAPAALPAGGGWADWPEQPAGP